MLCIISLTLSLPTSQNTESYIHIFVNMSINSYMNISRLSLVSVGLELLTIVFVVRITCQQLCWKHCQKLKESLIFSSRFYGVFLRELFLNISTIRIRVYLISFEKTCRMIYENNITSSSFQNQKRHTDFYNCLTTCYHRN